MPVKKPIKSAKSVTDSGECNTFATEYTEVHEQRMALIRSYNIWYAVGCAVAFGAFWLLLHLSLTVSSLPIMFAAAAVASAIMWFAYRAVLTIDCEVVSLYPRIIFLEIVLGYDFYRDYLRRRPRGNSERSYVEKCEQIEAEDHKQLWNLIYSKFNYKEFPGKRRVSSHFRYAFYLSTTLYWLIVGLILIPQYFPWT